MPDSPQETLFVCWTTIDSSAAAEQLASDAVRSGLAACAQIDSGIVSVYAWEGRIERASEIRLWLKTTGDRLADLESFILARHPYDTPQWVALAAEKVGEKYLKWAR